MDYGFDSIGIGHFPAMVCSISAEGSLNLVAHQIQMFLLLTLIKSFFVSAFDACLPLSSVYSGLVRFQLLAQSHDIENQNFVSLHSGFIIIDFDEAADMLCLIFFLLLIFWFGYLVSVTCSRLHELTLVHNLRASQALFLPICAQISVLLASPYAVLFRTGFCFWVRVTVHFTSPFSLSCTELCKVSTRTVIMAFHRQLSLLRRLKVIAYIFSFVFV